MTDGDPIGRPKLELPRREEWGLPERPTGSSRGPFVVMAILLVAVIGLQVFSLLRSSPHSSAPPPRALVGTGVSDLPLRDISARLQRNNLPSAAARIQEELLRGLPLQQRDERRKTLLRLASLLVKARRYDEALVRLYQAEALHPDSQTQRSIDSRVQLCLQKLGKHDELAYEVADRSSPQRKPDAGGGPGAAAADREVARIGVDVITASDLDAMIAAAVDRRLQAIPGLAGEERETYRKRLLDEFASPERRLQQLRQIVARKVLFREGMERELDKSAEVQSELDAYGEELIARQVVLEAVRDRVRVSQSDLKNFFQANPERYVERAQARVRLAILNDEQKATSLLASVKAEEDFVKIASEHSLDRTTGADGGLVNAPVVEGDPFPLLGDEADLTAAVLATDAGKALAAPVKTARGFAIAFVTEKTRRRTPGFDEVRNRVTQDYVQGKEMKVQQELIDELFRKHLASVRTEAFIKVPGANTESDSK